MKNRLIPASSSLTFAMAASAVAVLVLLGCQSRVGGEGDRVAHESRGAELFSRHCALCHGEDGSGHGAAFGLLEPTTPDFGTGRFSLVTTVNGIPSEEDLVSTIARGMPGSAMPPFEWMPERDLQLLARHVRDLGTKRMADEIMESATRSGRDLDHAQARELARVRWTPGAVVEIPPALEANADVLSRGKDLYVQHCAACHGQDGKGRGPIRAWRDAFDFRMARDFTRGILRGAASHEEISARIVAGMPRSGMPPTPLERPEDTAALVTYVKSLMPAESADRLVQKHQNLRARRVARVPSEAGHADWVAADVRRVVLAPLAWSDDAITEMQVAALHDGKRLAIRLSWRDRSEDRSPIASDAAAIQFSEEERPPLFGMGSRAHPVNIWHWRSYRLRDLAGELDLLDTPHVRRDPRTGRVTATDTPVYRVTPPLRKSSQTADTVRARGMAAVENEDFGAEIAAAATWADGQWHVVLHRSLVTSLEREIQFEPGVRVQIAFALWNGAERRSTSFKSVTIWHALTLER